MVIVKGFYTTECAEDTENEVGNWDMILYGLNLLVDCFRFCLLGNYIRSSKRDADEWGKIN